MESVQEHYRRINDDRVNSAEFISWQEFNRAAEQAWEQGMEMRYVGADRNRNGRMFVAFADDKGRIYRIENDVVFTYQRDRRPVVRAVM